MQRWAHDTTNVRIAAEVADPDKAYVCPECRGTLRIRQGRRGAYFTHQAEPGCRLRGNDSVHEAVRSWLLQSLGKALACPEHYFPEIGRVADVAYVPAKTVFEIQVTPITRAAAEGRTADYWRFGWHVIWVLHTRQYGRREATPFEAFVASVPHYFTSIGCGGEGLFDEYSSVQFGLRRWHCFPPRRRAISSLVAEPFVDKVDETRRRGRAYLFWQQSKAQSFGGFVKLRRKLWSCHLRGDWLDAGMPRAALPSRFHRLAAAASTFLRLLWLYLMRR